MDFKKIFQGLSTFLNYLNPLGCHAGVFLLVLLSISSLSAETESRSKESSLTICLSSDIETMDPVNHRSRITQVVLKNVFDSLTTRDNDNKVIPQLANDWRIINDTTWEFSLRKGVKFHNGDEFTASDVVFTLNRIIDESISAFSPSPRKGLFSPVLRVTKKDDHTVIIETKHTWPALPLMLSLQEIVPEKYYKNLGQEKFSRAPVGTGPFKYISRKKNEEIILERYEEYYGGSPQRPPVQAAQIKNLIFKIVPSHIEQIALIKKRKANILYNIPPEMAPVIRMAGDIEVYNIPATKCVFAEINCSHPFFNDVRVRQALNYAVDVNTIIDQKLTGKAQILPTVFLKNASGFDPDLKPYSYNLARAKKLLDEAGFPKTHVIKIYANKNDPLFADSISIYLTKLGLKTKIKTVKEIKPQKKGKNARWDIFVGSWGNSTLDPMGIVEPKLKSDGAANFSGFKSADFDMLINDAQKTLSSLKRTELFHRIQTLIFNEAPMIFGYAPDEYYAVTRDVKNFHPSITGMLEMHDVYMEDITR